MKLNKKALEIIIAGAIGASMMSGCAGIGPQRSTLYEANNYKGTSAEYFANLSENETKLDAAETNREARCLKNLNEFRYKTRQEAYNHLGNCVDSKRGQDYLVYGIGAVIVDGIKLYGLVEGLKGGSSSSSGSTYVPKPPSNPTNKPTIGVGGSTGQIWTPIR